MIVAIATKTIQKVKTPGFLPGLSHHFYSRLLHADLAASESPKQLAALLQLWNSTKVH